MIEPFFSVTHFSQESQLTRFGIREGHCPSGQNSLQHPAVSPRPQKATLFKNHRFDSCRPQEVYPLLHIALRQQIGRGQQFPVYELRRSQQLESDGQQQPSVEVWVHMEQNTTYRSWKKQNMLG